MMVLAALPGIVRELLVTGNLVKPGNFSATINFLGSRIRKAGLGLLKKPLWVVADGAYAKAPFLKPAKALGMTVISRLRKDAALRTVPGPKPPGRRGPAPTYGDRRVELAKGAGQRRRWVTGMFDLYGAPAVKRYKTFVATWRPAGGA